MSVWRLIALIATFTSVAASVTQELVLTGAHLLPGGMDGCPTPTAATCRGGAPAVGVVLRRLVADGVPYTFVPTLERATLFPKLHPASWGVNMIVWHRLGAAAMVSASTFVTPAASVAIKPPPNMIQVLDAVDFAATNPLRRVVTPVSVDPATGIALVPIRTAYHESLDTAAAHAAELLQTLPAVSLSVPLIPVVLAFDADPAAVLAALRRADPAVAAAARVVVRWQGSPDPVPAPAADNGTWLVSLSVSSGAVHRVKLTSPAAAGPLSAVTVVAEPIDGAPPTGDAAYDADQAFLAAEAAKAASNNPVLGSIAGPVAAVSVPGKPRLCSAGECQAGNLWADAIRHATGAQIGLMHSAELRGPAWPAGPVRLQDAFNSFGYLNMLCRATVLGLTLVEMANSSVARNDFDPVDTTFRPMTALQQVSGMRVTYDRNRAPERRLIAVEVAGRSGTFEHVRRLDTYTVGTIEYACSAWFPYNRLLAGRFAGEVRARMLPASDLHRSLGEFLQSQTPNYPPGIFGRLVDLAERGGSASAGDMLAWKHSKETCPGIFDDRVATCKDAPRESTELFYILAIGGPSLATAGLIFLAWFCCRRGHRGRDNTNAPKDGALPFAIVFTDIQSSTMLWARCPAAMPDAVAQHHRLVRAELARHSGYEVKTVGDSFMAAFVNAAQAVRFALAVQESLYAAESPAAIDAEYRRSTDSKLSEADYMVCWHGLRVRIGVHFGEGNIVLDEVTGGYDYYGTVVNTAARVEAVAHGGQVCISGDVLDAVENLFLSRAVQDGVVLVTALGEHRLRGLDGPVTLHQLLPADLGGRCFPALRLDQAEATEIKIVLAAEISRSRGGYRLSRGGASLTSLSRTHIRSHAHADQEESRAASGQRTPSGVGGRSCLTEGGSRVAEEQGSDGDTALRSVSLLALPLPPPQMTDR